MTNQFNETSSLFKKNLVSFLVFFAMCFVVSAVGGLVTASSVGDWYQSLKKPAFNPPDWLFGPVWAVLYLLMAIAGWLVWCHKQSQYREAAIAVFCIQLGLNLLWSFIFFGAKNPGLAFLEICLLLGAIAVTAVLFWRVDRVAGLLLTPYFLWVFFAAVLNGAIWQLNAH